MKKHAKGPWEWSENLLISQNKPYDVVLRLGPSFRALKADAALIAAAPDLLEMLERMLERGCGRCGVDHCSRCQEALDVVLKAKGEL